MAQKNNTISLVGGYDKHKIVKDEEIIRKILKIEGFENSERASIKLQKKCTNEIYAKIRSTRGIEETVRIGLRHYTNAFELKSNTHIRSIPYREKNITGTMTGKGKINIANLVARDEMKEVKTRYLNGLADLYSISNEINVYGQNKEILTQTTKFRKDIKNSEDGLSGATIKMIENYFLGIDIERLPDIEEVFMYILDIAVSNKKLIDELNISTPDGKIVFSDGNIKEYTKIIQNGMRVTLNNGKIIVEDPIFTGTSGMVKMITSFDANNLEQNDVACNSTVSAGKRLRIGEDGRINADPEYYKDIIYQVLIEEANIEEKLENLTDVQEIMEEEVSI